MNARWKQLCVNPSAAFPTESPSPARPPPPPCTQLPAKDPDKPPPALAGRDSSRRLHHPLPFASLPRPPLSEASRGSEKLICSADELHRATRLSERKRRPGGAEGRFEGEHVWVWGGGGGGGGGSVYKFAYVNVYLHKLDATRAARF